jgi:predicted MPP superfamily phosphohydrolase
MKVAFALSLVLLLGLLALFFREVRRAVIVGAWSSRGRRILRLVLVTTPLAVVGLGFWSVFVEPNRLVTREETIQIQNWPRELSPLKIAVLSDIHVGGWFVDDQKLRQIVDRTNQLQADLIVILGDYMSSESWKSHRVLPEVFGPILKDLRAPLGVYSVLGNHDWWWNGGRVRRGLEANGVTVLDDDVVEIKDRGRSFWVAGLADLWTRPQHISQTIAKIPPGEPTIALTHNPDIFPRLPQQVQLLLAGHTHGGQVRFPIIGTLIQPSNYGQRYVRGHVIEDNHHLFVTTGIGVSILPIRFCVPPEIVLLTLRST